MNVRRRILFVACFVALAMTTALAVDRLGSPSIMPLLAAAIFVATLAGAPGLIHRRARPAALVLLPLGAYLVIRMAAPLPPDVGGVGGQLDFFLDQLRSAAVVYSEESTPLDVTRADGVRLLMTLIIYLSTGLAAFLALGRRLTLPAIAVLLVPLGFGLTVDAADRVVWLPILFLLLTGGLLMLSRSLTRRRWRPTDMLAAAATAATAFVLALSLVGATSVSASRPWWDWKAWGESSADGTSLSFNWMLNYPGLLEQEQGIEALRVTSPLPSYWRANALDHFNGTAWTKRRSRGTMLWSLESDDGSYSFEVPGADEGAPGRTITATFRIGSVASDYLPTIGSPRRLTVTKPMSVRVTEERALRADRPVGPGTEYELTAVVPREASADLVGQGRIYPADIQRYLALPFPQADLQGGPAAKLRWQTTMGGDASFREWIGLYRLSEQVVGDATDPYEIALRIERHLRTDYTYSLAPPPTRFRSPYAAFLFDTRVGYCQHFAGAMAVLLRSNGVPARVALGFTTGHKADDETYVVDTSNAHAWVEAYFPRSGWVTFDPTPGSSIPGTGASSAGSSFSDPYEAETAAEEETAADAETQAEEQRAIEGTGETGADAAGISPGGPPRWSLWAIGITTPLVVWPLGRAVLRRRRTHGGTPDQRLRASIATVRAVLAEHGVRNSSSDTLRDTARLVEECSGLDATAVAARAEAVLYGGRPATEEDVATLRKLRRELRRRLRGRRSRLQTLLSAYGLPVRRLERRPTSRPPARRRPVERPPTS